MRLTLGVDCSLEGVMDSRRGRGTPIKPRFLQEKGREAASSCEKKIKRGGGDDRKRGYHRNASLAREGA